MSCPNNITVEADTRGRDCLNSSSVSVSDSNQYSVCVRERCVTHRPSFQADFLTHYISFSGGQVDEHLMTRGSVKLH